MFKCTFSQIGRFHRQKQYIKDVLTLLFLLFRASFTNGLIPKSKQRSPKPSQSKTPAILEAMYI